MGQVEFFIICICIGFAINFLITMLPVYELPENRPILTIWILIDCLIMFFMQSHIGVGIYFMFAGEISKNIYSLYFLQR